jgi:hypothetical protein
MAESTQPSHPTSEAPPQVDEGAAPAIPDPTAARQHAQALAAMFAAQAGGAPGAEPAKRKFEDVGEPEHDNKRVRDTSSLRGPRGARRAAGPISHQARHRSLALCL